MNRILNYFRNFFKALFGISHNKHLGYTLNRRLSSVFNGYVGERTRDACQVSVVDAEGSGVAGVSVQFRVIDGPVELQGASKQTIITDNKGHAAIDVDFKQQGASIVVAELFGYPSQHTGFEGRSQGVVNHIDVYTPAVNSVDPGELTVEILALDFTGVPVTNATLVLQGAYFPDVVLVGEVRELGDGKYEGTIKSTRAGNFEITVQEMNTRVYRACRVCMVPDAPVDIQLVGETNPRIREPRNEVFLRAVLLDQYGNTLEPESLHASVGGQELKRTIRWGEAHFYLSFTGYGEVTVRVWDANSSVSNEFDIPFWAVSFSHPGLIRVDSQFELPLYLFLPPHAEVQQATIKMSFDHELTSFVNFRSAESTDNVVTTELNDVAPGLISIDLKSRKPLLAADFAGGIYIGDTVWNCLGEGQTCFSAWAEMSPRTQAYEDCFFQKLFGENLEVCIRIIYPVGDTEARDKGVAAAKLLDEFFYSSMNNLWDCCPNINFNIQTCFLYGRGLDNIRRAIGPDMKISTFISVFLESEADKLVRTATACNRENCLNVLMIRSNNNKAVGLAYPARGVCIVDPDVVSSWSYYSWLYYSWSTRRAPSSLMAHEIGHLLGLDHPNRGGRGDPERVMGQWGYGNEFTEEECETISANIRNFLVR